MDAKDKSRMMRNIALKLRDYKNEGSILFSTHQDIRFKMFEEIIL